MTNEITNSVDCELALIDKFQKLEKHLMRLPAFKKFKEGQLMMCMIKGRELNMSPMEAVEQLDVINDQVTMRAQAMNKRVRQCGHSVTVVAWDKEKCSIKGVRKDTGDEMIVTYTIEDAILAGLTGKNNWKNHPKSMLFARAMSALARSHFPDCLYGVYTPDEVEEIKVKGETVDSDPFISENEQAFIHQLIGNDEERKNKLFNHFGIEDFSGIRRSQWDDVMKASSKYITQIREKKDDSSAVA